MATRKPRTFGGAMLVMNSDVPMAMGMATPTATRATRAVPSMIEAMPNWPRSVSHSEVVKKLGPAALSADQASMLRKSPTATMIASTTTPERYEPPWKIRSPRTLRLVILRGSGGRGSGGGPVRTKVDAPGRSGPLGVSSSVMVTGQPSHARSTTRTMATAISGRITSRWSSRRPAPGAGGGLRPDDLVHRDRRCRRGGDDRGGSGGDDLGRAGNPGHEGRERDRRRCDRGDGGAGAARPADVSISICWTDPSGACTSTVVKVGANDAPSGAAIIGGGRVGAADGGG